MAEGGGVGVSGRVGPSFVAHVQSATPWRVLPPSCPHTLRVPAVGHALDQRSHTSFSAA